MGIHSQISLGPQELSKIYKAFDAVWEVAQHHYDLADVVSTDAGRVRLANVLLAAYRRGLTDPDRLKVTALVEMGISS